MDCPTTPPSLETATAIGERFAFFDVDETLVKFKSMFSFDAFWSWNAGPLASLIGGLRHRRFMSRMTRYVEHGRSREFINALYYSRFAGRSEEQTRSLVARWFEQMKAMPGGIYIPATLEILREHQRQGTAIVLVSGSFIELLAPIAEELAVDHILATRLEIVGGQYTGKILPPQMIGAGKAFAARALLAERRADASACWAYGDHVSDLPLLEEVGHPHIVSSDPLMKEMAEERGWGFIEPDIDPFDHHSGL
ncbi:HAD superfamily hydrolase (TIGR01490 family) [Breoghania corrubedonensis]|uniref:HAD superfamily hydrolase (TIGR01490 family) n=1 Tax=Breoghania corrubedonensis TaxID=665038 RepID=A0A2T5VE47_9HYPH|nr:HAD family hydrolase [Breoghania corrubedonensis]PTW62030.1 HAD superfamily hydrolase (TIGR01490 family) [Breoghania corrubedonensis]